jgi:hypothetical protein
MYPPNSLVDFKVVMDAKLDGIGFLTKELKKEGI